jgi:hypothetical protein
VEVSPFLGFARETVSPLAGLRDHNDREWFTANRDLYENALLEPARDLVEAIGAELAGDGYEVGDRTYKRLPAGFDAPDERAPLLLHSGLYAGIELEHPEKLYTGALLRFCVSHFRKLKPL